MLFPAGQDGFALEEADGEPQQQNIEGDHQRAHNQHGPDVDDGRPQKLAEEQNQDRQDDQRAKLLGGAWVAGARTDDQPDADAQQR